MEKPDFLARDSLLGILDALLVPGYLRQIHFAAGGKPPVDAWVPGHAHLEVVQAGTLPIEFETGSGPRALVMGARTALFCPVKAWNRRSYATSRALFCIHFFPEYLRFTRGNRAASDPEGMEPQSWYHSARAFSPAGALVLKALEAAIREGRGPGILMPLLRTLLALAREELAADDGARVGRRHDTWQRVKDHVAQRFHFPLNRNKVAEDLGLNPDYVSRLFTVEGGESFHAFLTRLRLERAVALLAAPGAKIAEVARRSGFPDSGYFSKVFTRRFGVPPGSWHARRLASGRGGSPHAI